MSDDIYHLRKCIDDIPDSQHGIFFKEIINKVFVNEAWALFSLYYKNLFKINDDSEVFYRIWGKYSKSDVNGLEAEHIYHSYILSMFLKGDFSKRIDRDINILAKMKEDAIFYDSFGDIDESGWDSIISQYIDSKVQERLEEFASFNADEILNEAKSLGLYFPYVGSPKGKIILAHEGNLSGTLACEILMWLGGHFFKQLVHEREELDRNELAWMCEGDKAELDGLEEGYDDIGDEESIGSENILLPMSGHEYEKYIAERIINETSLHAEVTSGSGDQGGDIIINGMGFNAVAQVKYYSGKVGNKAIQEAYSAKSYYGSGVAMVITNSTYTKSAYNLAKKTGVIALNEDQVIKMLRSLG